MGSNALFSDQEIQQAGGGAPSTATASPHPDGSLFSDQEIQTAGGPQATPSKNFDVGAALGGMHGGSYDIAFRDPKGQISPDTIKAEAVGGSAGVAADAALMAVPELASTYGKAAVDAVSKMAAAHPFAAQIVKHLLTTGATSLGGGYTAAHILKALGAGGK